MEAQVWMTGRVGGDVEVRDSTSPWSTFRLACTPRTVRAGEWGDEQTTWVTVSCSHRLAEHVRLSLRKGDPVIVVGKLRTRRWFDANGLEHEQLQIRASSVGHDLSAGTSSFYRLRRESPADAPTTDADAAEPGDDAEDVFYPGEFEQPAAEVVAAEPEARAEPDGGAAAAGAAGQGGAADASDGGEGGAEPADGSAGPSVRSGRRKVA
ncbi:MAG: single-stranded DNA-binding protein [Propionicimonas sp.]